MSARRVVAPLVSIVIPNGGRDDALRRCLHSLQAQANPPSYELLVSLPPHSAAEALVTDLFPAATVVQESAATAAERRNALIARAAGELVLFLDDDVVVPPDYLATLAEQAGEHPDDVVLGGPNVTPATSSAFQMVQGAVLGSVLGSGPVRRRYGRRRAGHADERSFTLCNLAIRRSYVTTFDAELVCAEENDLLDRLRRAGARMRYDPRLWAAHDRRPDVRSFAEQMFKYGRGRGQLARRSPGTLRLAHLVPSAALLTIVVLTVAAAGTGNPWIASPIAAYLLALLLQSAKIAITLRRPSALPAAAGITMLLHGCYGAGVMVGLSEPATGPARGSPMHHARMLRVLVYRQLKLLRKRSLLGLLWPLLTPLVMLALYIFVFHTVLDVAIPRYGVFLFAGLMPWSFLSQTLGTAVTSLSFEAELIRRARFPYWLIPLATEVALSTYFLLTLAGFVGYLAVIGVLRWAVLPLVLFPVVSLYFFVGAVACVLALIDVYNRDLRQVLGNILTVWFFLVPIVYQQNTLSRGLLFMRSVDPLNLIIGEFRSVLYYGKAAQPLHQIIVLFATAGLLMLATAMIGRISSSLPKDV